MKAKMKMEMRVEMRVDVYVHEEIEVKWTGRKF
jgi:hypothetical protein